MNVLFIQGTLERASFISTFEQRLKETDGSPLG